MVTNIAYGNRGSVIGIGGSEPGSPRVRINKSDQIVAGVVAMFLRATCDQPRRSVATPWERCRGQPRRRQVKKPRSRASAMNFPQQGATPAKSPVTDRSIGLAVRRSYSTAVAVAASALTPPSHAFYRTGRMLLVRVRSFARFAHVGCPAARRRYCWDYRRWR